MLDVQVKKGRLYTTLTITTGEREIITGIGLNRVGDIMHEYLEDWIVRKSHRLSPWPKDGVEHTYNETKLVLKILTADYEPMRAAIAMALARRGSITPQ